MCARADYREGFRVCAVEVRRLTARTAAAWRRLLKALPAGGRTGPSAARG